MSALSSGCAPSYTDGSLPTGRGRQLALVFLVILLVGTAGSAGSHGNGVAVGFVLTLLARLPVPFLLWWDGDDHFGASHPAPPVPPAVPEAVPERQALTDRWRTGG